MNISALSTKILEIGIPRIFDLISLLLHDNHAIPMPVVYVILVIVVIDRLAHFLYAAADFTRALKSKA